MEWLFGSSSAEPALPAGPPAGQPLLPFAASDDGSALYGEPVPLVPHVPGGAVTALLHLADEQVAVGTEEGRLHVYQLHAGDGLDACATIASVSLGGRGAQPVTSVCEAGGAAFALCGGALVGAPLPTLEPLAPLSRELSAVCEPICAVCARQRRHDDPPDAGAGAHDLRAAPGTVRVCAATETSVSLLCHASDGLGNGRWTIEARALLPHGSPPPRVIHWASTCQLVFTDAASRVCAISADDIALGGSANISAEDAPSAEHVADGAATFVLWSPAGGSIPAAAAARSSPLGSPASTLASAEVVRALPLTSSEVLLVGGAAGGAAVCVGVDASTGRRTRAHFPIAGGGTGWESATLGWPILAVAGGQKLRLYDCISGTLRHTTRLPGPASSPGPVGTPPRNAAATPPRLCVSAYGAHSVLFSRRDGLYLLPTAPSSSLARERRWLCHVAARPWDAVIVEQHLAAALSMPSHILSRSLAQLASCFAAARTGPGHANGATSDVTPAMCERARFHVARLQVEALRAFPHLAPRGPSERANGAAGLELLAAVERAAFGAIRRTLSSAFIGSRSREIRRYEQQLRLLSHRVRPSHLHLNGDRRAGSAASSAEPFARAVARLGQLSSAPSPSAMLGTLVSTCRDVSDELVRAGSRPPSADELMPLVAYVLLRARVGNLPAELAMLHALAKEDEMLGEQGYCLATFQVAYTWAMQLKWDTLHHPPAPDRPSSAARARSPRRPESRSGARDTRADGLPHGGARPRSAAARGRGDRADKSRDSRRASAGGMADGTGGAIAGGASLSLASIASSMELLRSLEADLSAAPAVAPAAAIGAAGAAPVAGCEGSGTSRRDPSPHATCPPRAESRVSAAALRGLPVASLLRLAKSRGLDCSGCVEKADLVSALARAGIAAPAAAPAPTSPAPTVVAPTAPADRANGAPYGGAAEGEDGDAVEAAAGSALGSALGSERPTGRPLPRLGAGRERRRERLRDDAVLRVSSHHPMPAHHSPTKERSAAPRWQDASSTSPRQEPRVRSPPCRSPSPTKEGRHRSPGAREGRSPTKGDGREATPRWQGSPVL